MTKYDFNVKIFDEIDTPEKAYWTGFIWCDAYVCKRQRKTSITYEFKLELSQQDVNHLEKLKTCMNSNHEIKYYKFIGFGKEHTNCRLYISNNYFAKNLYENIGLIPHRFETEKLIKQVPEKFYRDLIRGIFDAEGGFSYYYHTDKNRLSPCLKISLGITTYETLLEFIKNHFMEKQLIVTNLKLSRRHDDRDDVCKQLKISGTQ
jgi:hypothetical protein